MLPSSPSSPSSWHRDETWRNGTRDCGTEKVERGEAMTSGFHHVALVCKSMKQTVAFYEQALGMKLRCIIPMHGVPGAKHCFLEAGNHCEISFIEFPTPRKGEPSISFPASALGDTPVGTQHHMAYRATSLDHLKRLRNQVKATKTPVSKIVDHGFCHSCYFSDPNGYLLEITSTYRPYDCRDYDITLLTRRPGVKEEHFDAQLLDSTTDVTIEGSNVRIVEAREGIA